MFFPRKLPNFLGATFPYQANASFSLKAGHRLPITLGSFENVALDSALISQNKTWGFELRKKARPNEFGSMTARRAYSPNWYAAI